MKIEFTQFGETATIEGDDALIHESVAYQCTFERQVKLIVDAFYCKRKKEIK